MESNEPITAKEFWRQRYRPYLTELTGEEFIQFDEEDLREYAVLFANHHRGQQIEAIKECYILDEFDGIPYALNEKSIENAYPEDRIK